MSRVAIGSTIRASFGFLAPAWRSCWMVLGLVVLVNTGYQLLYVNGQVGGLAVALAFILLQLIFSTMALAGLYRTALSPDRPGDRDLRPGTGGVQWAGPEWRVLLINLMVGVTFTIIFLMFMIVWLIAVGMIVGAHIVDVTPLQNPSMSPDQAMQALMTLLLGPVGVASLVIGLIGTVVCVYLGTRISLYAVRAADTASLDLGRAWVMTRGATAAIICASLVVGLLVLALEGLMVGLGIAIANALHKANAVLVGFRWGLVGAVVLATPLSLPLGAGVSVSVYRAQRGGGPAVADHFA